MKKSRFQLKTKQVGKFKGKIKNPYKSNRSREISTEKCWERKDFNKKMKRMQRFRQESEKQSEEKVEISKKKRKAKISKKM